MGIKFVKESNACERCEKQNTEVGTLTHYKEHDADLLLCQNCIKEIEDYYSLICSRCNKPAHMRGNLIEYKNEKICTICMDKIKMKEITKQEQKQFIKRNWAKWIGFGLTIVGIIVAYFVIVL